MAINKSRMVVGSNLVDAARKKLPLAYAPYSHFAVACALLTESGEIVFGVNVENASYGLTICAERAAVFSAVSQGYKRFQAIGITTARAGSAAPCGACRQVLSEFMDSSSLVWFSDGAGAGDVCTIGDLLPKAFVLSETS